MNRVEDEVVERLQHRRIDSQAIDVVEVEGSYGELERVVNFRIFHVHGTVSFHLRKA